MNTVKIICSFIGIIIFTLSSCGDSGLSGTFVPKVKNRIKSIEFKNGNARFTDSFLEIKQGCMEFDVKGDLIKIKDPFTGLMIFKIIDIDTIKCEIPGMSGFYKRQK